MYLNLTVLNYQIVGNIKTTIFIKQNNLESFMSDKQYKFAYLNNTLFNYSNLFQNIEMVVLTVVSFFLPIIVGHPQLLLGVLINAFLIRGAFSLKGYRILPVIIMPSLGAISAGLLFGSSTKFLIYLAVPIWIGNAILVYFFKRMNFKKGISYFTTLIKASLSKAAFLFIIALILFSLNIIPVMLLSAMSYFQLITALLGGLVVYGEVYLEKKLL